MYRYKRLKISVVFFIWGTYNLTLPNFNNEV